MTQLLYKYQMPEIMSLLINGEIVAFPTDTVFGIGVIYNDEKAINKMKVAKSRDAAKPFPLMVANASQLKEVAYVSDRERKIIKQFTPGALTLVLNKKDVIKDEYVNGFKTVAIRIPDDSFDLKLLRKAGPMFVTSANLSGEPACNTHEEVMEKLNGRIGGVVRGKAVSHIASTIIDCTGEEIKCLREGTVKFADILQSINSEEI